MTAPRGVYELAEDLNEVGDDDNVDGEHFFQENERIECTINEDFSSLSFVQDIMARSSTSGRGRGGGRGSGRDNTSADSFAPQQSDARQNVFVSSLHDNGDDIVEEFVSHVSLLMRGPAAQVQVPDPINREWLWVVHHQFSNQKKATGVILSILKSMWNGPWERWKDSWKDKSKRNSSNRREKLGRDISWEEIWRQSHCKKGKRPLDKLSDVGNPIIDNLDLEEDVKQKRMSGLIKDPMIHLRYIKDILWRSTGKMCRTPPVRARRKIGETLK
ncbi:hypothetical protein E3N88_02197 [Mikania micrantha]|uniref:Uncharacterized protein n=1 Tax=Mikania micrantha TaxID=192012 RepID=A0A5N6Q533_9ASTR|nr:hypothetical protein E3N88_02197 [Mikania micrantha]